MPSSSSFFFTTFNSSGSRSCTCENPTVHSALLLSHLEADDDWIPSALSSSPSTIFIPELALRNTSPSFLIRKPVQYPVVAQAGSGTLVTILTGFSSSCGPPSTKGPLHHWQTHNHRLLAGLLQVIYLPFQHHATFSFPSTLLLLILSAETFTCSYRLFFSFFSGLFFSSHLQVRFTILCAPFTCRSGIQTLHETHSRK